MNEDKLIDQIVEILEMMNAYVPTTPAPANPQLPLIQAKVAQMKGIRAKSKAKFALHMKDLVEVGNRISKIKLNSND